GTMLRSVAGSFAGTTPTWFQWSPGRTLRNISAPSGVATRAIAPGAPALFIGPPSPEPCPPSRITAQVIAPAARSRQATQMPMKIVRREPVSGMPGCQGACAGTAAAAWAVLLEIGAVFDCDRLGWGRRCRLRAISSCSESGCHDETSGRDGCQREDEDEYPDGDGHALPGPQQAEEDRGHEPADVCDGGQEREAARTEIFRQEHAADRHQHAVRCGVVHAEQDE